MLLATAAQTKEADRQCIEMIGIPGIVLMENAANGAVRILMKLVNSINGLKIAAFCGRGNNGGDGLAICRILSIRGALTTAYLFTSIKNLTNNAATNLTIAKNCGVKIIEISNEANYERYIKEMLNHNFYLDALLGIGINNTIGGLYAKAIDFLNQLKQPVLSIDIPSGLSADTGLPLGRAVQADYTITFGILKTGLLLEPGKYVGKLYFVNIGIPPIVIKNLNIKCNLLEPKQIISYLKPRPLNSHKGSFGHLLVVGGSIGKSGAACLTASAGLKSGAGLITLAIPEGLNIIAENKLTTIMSYPLAQTSDGNLSIKAMSTLLKLESTSAAIAIGPGLGQTIITKILIQNFLTQITIPMVIDADGLNALVGYIKPEIFKTHQIVITPHPAEAARLLSCTINEVQNDRLNSARCLAKISGAVVILKGARTIVSTPKGKAWTCLTGNPLLASAGSGDVLTGIIGGLLAQGCSAIKAALIAVYIHGLAADLAAMQFGIRGLAAEELITWLIPAFISLDPQIIKQKTTKINQFYP